MTERSIWHQPIDFKRLDALLNPKSRELLRTRFVSADWLVGPRWDPWFDLRVFRFPGARGLHLEVGRLYLAFPGHKRPLRRALTDRTGERT